MTATKIYKWIKAKIALKSNALSQIHFKSLTGKINTILKRNKQTELPIIESSADPLIQAVPEQDSSPIKLKVNKTEIMLQPDLWTVIRGYRTHLAKSLGAIGLVAAISVTGSQYVKVNTNEIFHVYVNDMEVGSVSAPEIVEDFKIAKYKQLLAQYPDTHMILNVDEVTLKSEKAFNLKADDAHALEQLDQKLVAQAVGVELIVDDKTVGILKDQETAEQVLDRIKQPYTGTQERAASGYNLLSASTDLQAGQSELEKAEFVQHVDLKRIQLDPKEIGNPDEIFTSLQTGNVQPMIYTVAKGDCLGCIAQKLGVTTQFIQANNPGVVDDRIKEGQQLNLTVDQPKLTVRTVEKLVENQEVQYDTEYIKDANAREGVIETISPGKNGLKKVSYEITKVNGQMVKEEMLNEQMLEVPVKAVVRKGTKVVLGEGSGTFSWPVLSFTMTSGFGYRNGKMHKGLDLSSSNRNIIAADNGKIITATYKSDYGNYIVIDHMNGYRTLYAHLSQIGVKVGQIVEKGEKIGVMGSTGDSTGTHLHFEVIRNGSIESPLKYLNR